MATDAENPSSTIANNASGDKPAKTLDEVKGSTDVVDSSTKTGLSSVSDTEKKIRRAERFGITVQLSEQEKRNSRAERFGTGYSSNGSGVSKRPEEVNSDASQKSEEVSSDASKKSEELKRKARAERFGIAAPANASEDEVKKKARLERFGSIPKLDSREEEKRKARALRFAQAPVASVSINGDGNIEPKAAIAGDAGGGGS